jgi:hypothetical protein
MILFVFNVAIGQKRSSVVEIVEFTNLIITLCIIVTIVAATSSEYPITFAF